MLTTLLTQVPKDLGSKKIEGIGPLGGEGKSALDLVYGLFPNIVSAVIGVLTAFAILWFILQFILGAFKWISSGGDSKSIESARNQIIQAVIGLLVVFLALIIVSILGGIFGIEVLDLGRTLLRLGPSSSGFVPGGTP